MKRVSLLFDYSCYHRKRGERERDRAQRSYDHQSKIKQEEFQIKESEIQIIHGNFRIKLPPNDGLLNRFMDMDRYGWLSVKAGGASVFAHFLSVCDIQ